MVRTRVAMGLGLGLAAVALLVVDSRLEGGPVFYALIGALMVAALLELYALAERGGDRPRKVTAAVLVAVLVVTQQFVARGACPPLAAEQGAGLLAAFYPFLGIAVAAGTVFLALDQLLWCEPTRYLHDLSVTALGFFYVWGLGAHVLALRSQWGTAFVVVALAAAKLSDVGAYFVGTLVGRHRFAPRLSPKKSLEGAAGGLATAAGAALLAAALLVGPPVAAGFWLAFGAAVGLAAQLGDLVASALKRSVGAKDSGRLVPTFGGVLDIVDSVILSGPAALWLLELWGRRVLPPTTL